VKHTSSFLPGFIKWLIVTAFLTWIVASFTFDWVTALLIAVPITLFYQILRPR
jgi:hypothetical protein